METGRNHKGWGDALSFTRRPPRSILLHYLMFCLLSLSPAFLVSCDKHIEDDSWEWTDYQMNPDSSFFAIMTGIQSNSIETLTLEECCMDLFAYEADGLKNLCFHEHYSPIPDTVRFKSTKSEKLVVCIANCLASFNETALSRYDSIELLSYKLSNDDPSRPLMSGMCLTNMHLGNVVLKPLMSKICLREVTNNMKHYQRLEDPIVYLTEANSEAEIMRENGFRPSGNMSDTLSKRLPCDVGIFTQTPSIMLYCYPNDSESPDIGSPATNLVLECKIKAQTVHFPIEIHPIRRNQTIYVDITVDNPDTYSWKVQY